MLAQYLHRLGASTIVSDNTRERLRTQRSYARPYTVHRLQIGAILQLDIIKETSFNGSFSRWSQEFIHEESS